MFLSINPNFCTSLIESDIDSLIIGKALELENNNELSNSELIKAIRDRSHLVPVKKQFTNRNGRSYMKTVYVTSEQAEKMGQPKQTKPKEAAGPKLSKEEGKKVVHDITSKFKTKEERQKFMNTLKANGITWAERKADGSEVAWHVSYMRACMSATEHVCNGGQLPQTGSSSIPVSATQSKVEPKQAKPKKADKPAYNPHDHDCLKEFSEYKFPLRKYANVLGYGYTSEDAKGILTAAFILDRVLNDANISDKDKSWLRRNNKYVDKISGFKKIADEERGNNGFDRVFGSAADAIRPANIGGKWRDGEEYSQNVLREASKKNFRGNYDGKGTELDWFTGKAVEGSKN